MKYGILTMSACLPILLINAMSQSGSDSREDIALGAIQRIISDNPKEAIEGERIIREHRKKLVGALIEILSNNDLQRKNPSAIARAMRLLGELRAREAIPTLVSMIDFVDPWDKVIKPKLDGSNGAPIVALMQIGPEVMPAILRKICEEDNYDKLYGCASYVLAFCNGDKDATNDYISKNLSGESDRKVIERRDTILKIVSTFK